MKQSDRLIEQTTGTPGPRTARTARSDPGRGLLPGLALLAAVVLTTKVYAADPPCNRVSFQNCLNGVSSSVTNGAGLRESGGEFDDVAHERSTGRESGSATPAAVAEEVFSGELDAGSVFGLWGSYSYNDFDSDFVFQGSSLAYDADAHNVLGGIDRLFAGRLLLGVAFGYQAIETATRFNGGGQDTDGHTLAPYAALLLSDVFSVDLSGGYSWLDYDQDRISPADGTDIASGFDAERWFVAGNLNAIWPVGRWVLSGKVGYLHTDEDQDGYVETGSAASAAAGRLRTVTRRTIDLSQVVAGGELAYTLGAFEPYVYADYRNDLSRNDGNRAGGLPGNFTSVQPDDDDEVQIGVGLRHFTSWGVTSTLEYQRVEGRSHFGSDLFMLSLRAAL